MEQERRLQPKIDEMQRQWDLLSEAKLDADTAQVIEADFQVVIVFNDFILL